MLLTELIKIIFSFSQNFPFPPERQTRGQEKQYNSQHKNKQKTKPAKTSLLRGRWILELSGFFPVRVFSHQP